MGNGWGCGVRSDCRELQMRVRTRCTHAVLALQTQTSWAMPTVTPAWALRALLDVSGGSNARYAKVGRAAATIAKAAVMVRIAMGTMLETQGMSRRPLPSSMQTHAKLMPSHTATRVHREVADVGPHPD